MRQFIIAGALAIGLIALWAAILPLTAQPAPAATRSPLTQALFLCRGKNGVDQACAAALAKSLVLDEPASAERVCHADPKVLASLRRRA